MRFTKEQLLDHITKEITEISEDLNSNYTLLTAEQRSIVDRLSQLKNLMAFVGGCLLCEYDCLDNIPVDLTPAEKISEEYINT